MSSFPEKLQCVVCLAACTARCGRCHRVAFCGQEHQKLMWPMHKTQCDANLEFFRAAPLSKAEVNALILIDTHNMGVGSYPLTADEVSLREALTRFGVSRLVSVQSLATPLSITRTKTHTLEQSKLAFLFRFFLRSYRYPNHLHAIAGRMYEGHTSQTGNTFLSQTIFPFLVNALDGKPAFRLPPGENEILVYLRPYFELALMYTVISLVSGGLSNKIDRRTATLAEQQEYESLLPLHKISAFRARTEWEKMNKEGRLHPGMWACGLGCYTRGVFGMEPSDNRFSGDSFYLERADGLLV